MAHSSSWLSLLLSIWVASLLCSANLSAPLESDGNQSLVKRDDLLYDIWSKVKGSQKATGDSALAFKIDQSVDDAWGITYLYGCTALLISDPDFVIVAHMQQETSTGKICINDPTTLNKWLSAKLLDALLLHDATENTMVELIYNTNNCAWTGTGVKTIRTWLTDTWGVEERNIFPRAYIGSTGLGIPNPGRPQGLAVVRWLKPELEGLTLGTLQTFFNADTPNRDQVFVSHSSKMLGAAAHLATAR